MTTVSKSLARVAMPLALCMVLTPAAAQTPREQAEKVLARKGAVGKRAGPAALRENGTDSSARSVGQPERFMAMTNANRIGVTS